LHSVTQKRLQRPSKTAVRQLVRLSDVWSRLEVQLLPENSCQMSVGDMPPVTPEVVLRRSQSVAASLVNSLATYAKKGRFN